VIPALTAAEIHALRTRLAERGAEPVAELDWLDALDVIPPPQAAQATRELAVGVFNAERGTHFDGIVALLTQHEALRGVDVWLLNEVDWGMARSANRHVARELAARLGMGGIFAIEFIELSKGFGPEAEAPGDNSRSLHGNAILSRYALRRPRVQRLPGRCAWAEGDQPRIGGRMALLAELDGDAGGLTLVCTHLENRTSPAGRLAQMQALLDALPPGAALIGGDLNTATIDGARPEELYSIPDHLRVDPERLRRPQTYEPLFGAVRGAGFDIEPFNAAGVPTAVPLGIDDQTYWLKLDWLFGRGATAMVDPHSPCVVPARHAGRRVSDHDIVVARVVLPAGEAAR
jgi:endonuclease/exonuclease/phosphatase family metal-dependent hydrolase